MPSFPRKRESSGLRRKSLGPRFCGDDAIARAPRLITRGLLAQGKKNAAASVGRRSVARRRALRALPRP